MPIRSRPITSSVSCCVARASPKNQTTSSRYRASWRRSSAHRRTYACGCYCPIEFMRQPFLSPELSRRDFLLGLGAWAPCFPPRHCGRHCPGLSSAAFHRTTGQQVIANSASRGLQLQGRHYRSGIGPSTQRLWWGGAQAVHSRGNGCGLALFDYDNDGWLDVSW